MLDRGEKELVLELNLTKEEAFALLTLALASPNEDNETCERALRKLVGLCRAFLNLEAEKTVPRPTR